MRKPQIQLTQAETDALNSVLERAAQRLERRKKPEEAETLTGILKALADEPRDE